MSCLLCCFKSLSLCGMRDCLLGMIAFRPPQEQSTIFLNCSYLVVEYEIQTENSDSKKPPLYVQTTLLFDKLIVKCTETSSIRS